ncbi:Transcriptional modulator of MazE/toxin, MazF [Desulfamplus magnetovallimortis]|uniref:mRNA interferase n=1 Tax=Desulfamplus magnetovallimortis TaxID=1246637 RepID=A0A1W1HBJ9_9BACT|nr:type II toxin-antitoxin system PemK/MazF family toxin [Desulfamplus magnetovallimortis]SLM29867.1 Transcriptional modulator of MazE/toxin, MazF [Desulfamplus magnetovallimortis]
MKKYQRGQIWLVNFDPSIGHEYRKIRPALIIQQDIYISSSGLLTVIPISSKIEKLTELDLLLEKDESNRLMKNSLLKTKQISSFDKKRFIKFIGTVEAKIMEAVDQNIGIFLLGE